MKYTIYFEKILKLFQRFLLIFGLLPLLCMLSLEQISAQYSILQEFTKGNDGSSHPIIELVSDANFLYGTVSGGGANNCGYLFKMNKNGTGFQNLFDFGENNIGTDNTSISLIISGSTIYGIANKGGSSGSGVIFQIKNDGTGFMNLHDFTGADGNNPDGKLTIINTDLIGTTSNGGSNDDGTIFKYSIFGSTFEKIFDFNGTNGANPNGGLVPSGSSLYGLTSNGGLNDAGILFKINSDGSGFQNIRDFNDITGSHPLGSLIQDDSLYYYGTNSSGGENAKGNIFRCQITGTDYEIIKSFSGLDGNSPLANLTQIANRIYGTTYYGGSFDMGVLFCLYTDRPEYKVLYNFNSGNGYYPKTSLVAVDSMLLGTATSGGTYGGGVLFNYKTNYPFIQAFRLYYYFVQPGQMSVQWRPGNGSSRIVFVKKGNSGIVYPRDGISYDANSEFGKGSQIDESGWYCVHKGLGNSFYDNSDTITGLESNTEYRIMVIECNGNEGDEKYLLSTAENNPMNQLTRPGIEGFIETMSVNQPRTSIFTYSRYIIADGGVSIISHGICWATHSLPTLADSVHIDGKDVGVFNTCISHLKPNTNYYLRPFVLYPTDTIYGYIYSYKTKSVKSSIISAYDQLFPYIYQFGWSADPNNWIFGSIAGGDANKGSDQGDMSYVNQVQYYQDNPSGLCNSEKWRAMYEGITRCNDAIVAVNDSLALDSYAREPKQAELLFLRAFYYFELIKVFGPKLPWIDENTMLQEDPVPNIFAIWSQVENDFENSISNLPVIADSPGHVNVWAAKAFYAKLLLYEKKFTEAKAVFDDIIANGVTTCGTKYALLPCFDFNFNILYNNSSESVFAQQAQIDGINNMKANPGYCIAYPYGNTAPGGCCGFFQPSQSLVNSFQVDINGLPIFDPSHTSFPFNDADLYNDDGLYSSDFFMPDTLTPVDPRLDWTVGRRGIPYLDWGINPGSNWIRYQTYGGPYIPIKNVYRNADYVAGRTGSVGGWAPGSTLNYNLMRFADVLLMAAECEVELGDLNAALNYVNQIRSRASISHVKNGDKDAANYQIGTYPFFPDQQYAREAVRFERKLELAMEGHRFFDLVRWGEDYASQELNYGYLAHESSHRWHFGGAYFDPNCLTYFAIPQSVILYLPETKHIGDSDFELNAYSISGLPVSYSSSNTNVVKISGDMIKIIGLGTATVTVTQTLKPGCLPASTDSKVIGILPQENLGVASMAEKNMQIHPNPTTGLINFLPPEMDGITVLSVIDISGRTVYQQNLYGNQNETITIDLSFLEPASYIITIRNKNQIIHDRIIKE
jgi:starch-binding outer membrane protein, SusD/RagB family